MRAAGWLRPRDLPAAAPMGERTRDRRPTARGAERRDRDAVAPLDDVDLDDALRRRRRRHRRAIPQARDLAAQTADLKSLAIATAGRIQSFTVNEYRVPDAALLSAELEDIVGHLDCEAADKSVILNAVAMARLANCQFGDALHAVEGLLALRPDAPMVEVAPANAIRGSSRSASATTRRAGCTCSRRSGKRAHSRPFCTHRCCSSRVRCRRWHVPHRRSG